MTLDDIPTLVRFGRLYWNQMGADVYGSVQNAMRQMLEDGGEETRLALRQELTFIGRGDAYAKWLKKARYDIPTIRQLGGAFILPDEVPALLMTVESHSGGKPS